MKKTKLKLEPVKIENMAIILDWRHSAQETLRTPYLLTLEMQEKYFYDVICNRQGKTRYFEFYTEENCSKFVGYGGIENIEWENRRAEISLIIAPHYRGKGYGSAAVDAILLQAFNNFNLDFVWGECYTCGNVEFWKKIIKRNKAFAVELPNRKYYKGQSWASLYFEFEKEKKDG